MFSELENYLQGGYKTPLQPLHQLTQEEIVRIQEQGNKIVCGVMEKTLQTGGAKVSGRLTQELGVENFHSFIID